MVDGTQREELVHAFACFGPAWVRFLRASLADEAMSTARVRLLNMLRNHADAPIMRQLCDDLGTTPRAVTALADGLEAEGLLRRAPHPSDRRATVLRLTDAGERLMDSVWCEYISRASELFDDLSADDQAELLRILRLLLDGLHRRRRNVPPGSCVGASVPAARPGQVVGRDLRSAT